MFILSDMEVSDARYDLIPATLPVTVSFSLQSLFFKQLQHLVHEVIREQGEKQSEGSLHQPYSAVASRYPVLGLSLIHI